MPGLAHRTIKRLGVAIGMQLLMQHDVLPPAIQQNKFVVLVGNGASQPPFCVRVATYGYVGAITGGDRPDQKHTKTVLRFVSGDLTHAAEGAADASVSYELLSAQKQHKGSMLGVMRDDHEWMAGVLGVSVGAGLFGGRLGEAASEAPPFCVHLVSRLRELGACAVEGVFRVPGRAATIEELASLYSHKGLARPKHPRPSSGSSQFPSTWLERASGAWSAQTRC